jgi:subtilisin family serine protease
MATHVWRITTLTTVIALLAFIPPRLGLGAVTGSPEVGRPGVTLALSPAARTAVADGDRVRVIVSLHTPFSPEVSLPGAQAAQRQRAQIAQAQERVAGRLAAGHAQEHGRFESIPALVLEVDQAGLAALAVDAEVASVAEDLRLEPSLGVSNGLIGSAAAWAGGYTGAGQTIAVLDSGVDKTHPFLSDKVVAEACYSSNSNLTSSLCPSGATASTAAGSALNCPATLTGCDHGTHVAGIAAGRAVTTGLGPISGVAPGAQLIAIQVFSRVDKSACGSGATSDCITAFSSDIIKGLERVYALRSTYSIAAVNLSLGGGKYTAACDDEIPAFTAVVDNLRAAGIATVIAAGNSGYSDALSFPACISGAISVGSTTSSFAGAIDQVSSFSNSSSLLDLLAPGHFIYSSVIGTGYDYKAGTSMAAPLVAGAWAVLRSAAPSAGVAQALQAFQTTGLAITAARTGYPAITRSRIKVDAAVSALLGLPTTPTVTATPPTRTATPPTATATAAPTSTPTPSVGTPTSTPTSTPAPTPQIAPFQGGRGGPGSHFVFALQGFAPGERIAVTSAGYPVLTLDAGPEGKAAFTLYFGPSAAGTYTISANGAAQISALAPRSAYTQISVDATAAILPRPSDPGLAQANGLPTQYLPMIIR